MMDTRRDYGPDSGPDYNPAKGKTQNPPCMHAGAGPIWVSQTAGSLVSHLAEDVQTHWVTATSKKLPRSCHKIW